jgi:hypothetical protein
VRLQPEVVAVNDALMLVKDGNVQVAFGHDGRAE